MLYWSIDSKYIDRFIRFQKQIYLTDIFINDKYDILEYKGEGEFV